MAVQQQQSQSQLSRTLAEAVERRIITQEQAHQIAELGGPDATPAGEVGRRRPFVAEALGYLGGALALLAAVMLVERPTATR